MATKRTPRPADLIVLTYRPDNGPVMQTTIAYRALASSCSVLRRMGATPIRWQRAAVVTGAIIIASLTLAPAASAAPRHHASHDGTTTVHVDRTRTVAGDSETVTTDVTRTAPDGETHRTHTQTTRTRR